jgi:hypothetical protein
METERIGPALAGVGIVKEAGRSRTLKVVCGS